MTLFSDLSREQLRAAYREAWHKRLAGLPLQPLEAQIADVIAAHPEYQPLLADAAAVHRDFDASSGRGNPFLHLGLHLAVREQIGTDRPPGIAAIHQRLAATHNSSHAAEHRMIEVLAAVISEAHRGGQGAAETAYLERLRRL